MGDDDRTFSAISSIEDELENLAAQMGGIARQQRLTLGAVFVMIPWLAALTLCVVLRT